MASHLEELLRASVALAELRKRLAAQEALIATLRHEIGRLRLMADLKSDFEMSADGDISCLLKPQAG